MPAQRIAELEQQLVTANEAVEKFTRENADLAAQLADSEKRFKKLKRNARSDESSLRSQLVVAQSRRG